MTPTPAPRQEDEDPRRIGEAGDQVVGEDEDRPDRGGAFGEQVPARMDEGGEHDEKQRGKRH